LLKESEDVNSVGIRLFFVCLGAVCVFSDVSTDYNKCLLADEFSVCYSSSFLFRNVNLQLHVEENNTQRNYSGYHLKGSHNMSVSTIAGGT
jgi:hypothetical protein